MADTMELYQSLAALLDKLKRNRELVPLSELKSKYRKPYTALCEEIRAATSAYVHKVALHGIRIRKSYFEEAKAIMESAIRQSGLLRQISSAAFKRQDMAEIERLSLMLNEQITIALEPFYNQHLGLYLTEDCFANPPRTPDIYNDVTGCILRDGKWIPKETLYKEQDSAA